MKKIVSIIALLFITVLGVAGCGTVSINGSTTQQTALKNKVRMGIVPLPFYSHMWIAYKKGFLAENLKQVNTELIWKPISLGPVVNEAFAAGEIDLGVMGAFPAFVGKSAGTDFKIVSAMNIERAHAVLVNPNKNINSISDLKGKKVATTKNTSGYQLLITLLKQNNMNLQDVHFINMSMADLGTALSKGDIDAGVVWEPMVTRLESDGMKVLTDGAVCPNYAVLMANSEIITNNPEIIKAILNADKQGLDYMNKHPEECLSILSTEFNIPTQQLKKMLPKYNFIAPLDDKFMTDMKDADRFLLDNKILKQSIDINTFVQK